jgi:hypothetical protein
VRSHDICVKVFNYSNNIINEFPNITSVVNYFNISNITVDRYLDKNNLLNINNMYIL